MIEQVFLQKMEWEDLPLVAEMHQDMIGSWHQNIWADVLKDKYSQTWVLRHKNALIGFIAWRILGEEAEILTLYILPQYRRQGLGKRLIELLVKKCQVMGVRSIFLEVPAGNHPAIQLYSSHHFTPTGTRRNYYKVARETAIDALLMKKLL